MQGNQSAQISPPPGSYSSDPESVVRTLDSITTSYNLYHERPVAVSIKTLSNEFFVHTFTIEELEQIVRFAKKARVQQRKQQEKFAKQSLKHIQSL